MSLAVAREIPRRMELCDESLTSLDSGAQIDTLIYLPRLIAARVGDGYTVNRGCVLDSAHAQAGKNLSSGVMISDRSKKPAGFSLRRRRTLRLRWPG